MAIPADEPYCAVASYVPPPPIDDAPVRSAARRDAQRALALAIAGVLVLGFVLGPLSLALSQRARLADRDAAWPANAGLTYAAETLARFGLALHLTLAMSVLPWLLFALPLVAGR